MGVVKFMPHKIIMAMKNEMAFDDIFVTHELCPSVIFHGKNIDMTNMKI